MKNIITLIALIVTTVSFAQLKVTSSEDTKSNREVIGEHKFMGDLVAKVEKEGDFCVVTYKDDNYQTVGVYKFFIIRAQDLDQLYDLFTNYKGIEKGTVKNVDVEGGDKLRIVYNKSFGVMYPEIYHTDSKTGIEGKLKNLTPAQYRAMFGKKK
jgi:hypothetical protein